jgi:2-polyprenyl-3-methyl-5-hydroxy-6-metoxy-1,4-benzoquinol methylase
MLETLESCPSCGHQSFQSYIECKDYTVSRETFTIVECDKCSLLFTNPRPDENSLGHYYDSKEYISHTNSATNIIGTIYKTVRSIALKSKINLINSISKKGQLLDYGCGTGHFLNEAKNNGWQVTGIEPSSEANQNTSQEIKDHIYQNIQALDGNHKFDIITFWHVLEHISDLKVTLQHLLNQLSENGKFIIAVPNPKSYDANLYKQHWAAYDVPRHLYHFTQESLARFLNNFNLQIDSIHPMKFDSFYVSLLSEKYKSGKSNYLKSFINGYKSNSYAKNNNNNYSSLIYTVSRK